MKNAQKDFTSNWEDTVDLGRGEGRVQEPANLDVFLGGAFAKQFWQQHEMVVLNPNKVAILQLCINRVSKELVHALVGVPVNLVEGYFSRVIMEERPKDAVRESVVVVVGQLIIHPDWRTR